MSLWRLDWRLLLDTYLVKFQELSEPDKEKIRDEYRKVSDELATKLDTTTPKLS